MNMISGDELARVMGGAEETPSQGAGPSQIDVGALTRGPELGPLKEPGVKYWENDHSGKTGVQQAIENVDLSLIHI